MSTSLSRRARLLFSAACVAGVTALATLAPVAALGSTPAPAAAGSTGLGQDDLSAGAAMLGGWIGGGVLLLGTSVLVATTSVRQQRARVTEVAEA